MRHTPPRRIPVVFMTWDFPVPVFTISRSFPSHTSTLTRLVTASICICEGNIDHTSSEAPTTRADHVRSSDKEGGGRGGYRGTSR
jgi:hypothetical protein